MDTPRPPTPDDVETERDRRIANGVLLLLAVFVVVGGLWLLDTLFDQRAMDDCLASGRRNCAPVAVPAR
jgi:hypothetical protein